MNEQEKELETNNINKPDKPKRKLFNGLLTNLKKIKHLDIILTVLFIAIILLIYFSTFFNTKPTIDKNSTDNSKTYSATTSLERYTERCEAKLVETLSAIKEAGEVSVLLTFNKGIETVIAYTTETETSSNGNVTEVKSPVLITNNGKTETVVLQEIMPMPVSIVVVATGANNTNVKLEILRAVQAMFALPTSSIEIFAGN